MQPNMNTFQPDPALTAILQHGAEMDAANNEMNAIAQDARIAELASLSPLDYDRARDDAAKALNVRVSTLDAEVEKLRPSPILEKLGGSALILEDPIPWADPVEGGALLELLTTRMRQYLVVSEDALIIVALWVLFSHTHEAAGVSPMLCVTSPERGCGKSTLLSLLDGVVKRPLPASNVSPAALFRTVEMCSPTLLIDEGDAFLKENEELRGILNSGHTRALAYVLRCEGDKNEVRRFKTWCPKAIALIGAMHPTLEDRSIPIALTRKRPDESVIHLPQDCRTLLCDVQRKCAKWSLDHLDQLKHATPEMPTDFFNRTADNYRPLFAIADIIGGEWPEKARNAARRLRSARTDDDETARVKLLTDIQSIFQDRHTDRLSSADLIEALANMENRPWPEWKHGKPISAPQMARLLRPFGVVPGTVRLPDGTAKGYQLDWFEDAFNRYLSPAAVTSSQCRNDAASGDFQAVTTEDHVTDEEFPNSAPDKDCDGVTVPQGEAIRKVVNYGGEF